VRWALDPKKLNYRYENGTVSSLILYYDIHVSYTECRHQDQPFTSEYIIKTLVTALVNCGRPDEKIHVPDADDKPRGGLLVTMAAVRLMIDKPR
jgi:hypothetical protein